MILRKIVLPGALPAILGGFRATSGIAIVVLATVEMIGRTRDLGRSCCRRGTCDTDNLLAGIVVLSLLGVRVAWMLGRLER